MKRRNPDLVHEYVNRHGKTVYYLRRPGQKKVRLRIEAGVLPWSPSFMAVYEAALSNEAPIVRTGHLVPGTVNAAVMSYFQSPAFCKGLAKSTRQNRRAILESASSMVTSASRRCTRPPLRTFSIRNHQPRRAIGGGRFEGSSITVCRSR